MKVEIDEKLDQIAIKAEGGDVPFQVKYNVSTTTIITEEEFFNIHGFIFESDLKIEGTTLQVQDYAPRIDREMDEAFCGNGSDNPEIVCPKKVVVKLKRLTNQMMMSNSLCAKKVVLKVKKLSADLIKKYCTEATTQHIDTTTQNKYLCNICSKTFSHGGALKQHLHEHMGGKLAIGVRKWSCPSCQMKFFTSQELMVHRGTHTDLKLYQCKMCPMNFAAKGTLQSHVRDHNRHSNVEKPFQCYLCRQSFTLIHFLKNHMRIHTTKYDCRICMKIFEREVDLDMHMLTHSGKYRFECGECSKGFDYRTSFVRHMRIHSGEKPFVCELCLKTFREKDYLVAHKRTHAADKTIDPVDRSKYTWRFSNERKSRQSKTSERSGTNKSRRVGKVFKCKICFKLMKSEKELNHHFEGHTGEYLFECQECSKGFNYRPNLYRHMRQHTGEMPYKCHLCPRVYGDPGSLSAHIRCHNGEKAECDICLRKFSDKGYLKIHKRSHTGEMPFECPQCKGKYRAKQALQLHTCYKCDICLKHFPTKSIMIVHIRDHLKQGQTNFHYTKVSERDIGIVGGSSSKSKK